MIKRWRHYEAVRDVDDFARKAGVPRLIAEMLEHRGIRTPEEAEAFLNPEKQPFLDPFLMRDMDKAAARIKKAVEQKEKIVIYGDYDVDGMSATSLLLRFLRSLQADVSFYIPDRQTEGYGFHLPALERLASEGKQLLVSVDCGISAADEVRALQGKMDIVVTDHHLPGPELPPAVAVVNPHRTDCPYPDKDLAGVGVAFKLCQALSQVIRHEPFDADLELVTLGTVADIVPLRGENRHIVKVGVQRMKDSPICGIRALLDAAGLAGKELRAGHIGFQMAPRLNAAGRIATAQQGVKLLTTNDANEAQQIAQELNALNEERRSVERNILAAAQEQLAPYHPEQMSAIVVAGKGWHPGVIGIVASRLVELYYKPTVVCTIQDDGVCKGSCRSIEGFNMYEGLQACTDDLIQFGGHAQAAGLSLNEENLDQFRRDFAAQAASVLKPEDYIPSVTIEAELDPLDVTEKLVEKINRLEPYGMGNPQPLFGVRSVQADRARTMGKENQHLRFQFEKNTQNYTGIFWNKGEYCNIVNRETLDFVYVPSVHEWNGFRSVQCMIDSMRPAETERVAPDRTMLASLYRFLYGLRGTNGAVPYTSLQLADRYNMTAGNMSYYSLLLGLRIFEELHLLENRGKRGFAFLPVQGKMNLQDSPTFRHHMDQGAAKEWDI